MGWGDAGLFVAENSLNISPCGNGCLDRVEQHQSPCILTSDRLHRVSRRTVGCVKKNELLVHSLHVITVLGIENFEKEKCGSLTGVDLGPVVHQQGDYTTGLLQYQTRKFTQHIRLFIYCHQNGCCLGFFSVLFLSPLPNTPQ